MRPAPRRGRVAAVRRAAGADGRRCATTRYWPPSAICRTRSPSRSCTCSRGGPMRRAVLLRRGGLSRLHPHRRQLAGDVARHLRGESRRAAAGDRGVPDRAGGAGPRHPRWRYAVRSNARFEARAGSAQRLAEAAVAQRWSRIRRSSICRARGRPRHRPAARFEEHLQPHPAARRAGAWAKREIRDLLVSDDVDRMLEALGQLGVRVERGRRDSGAAGAWGGGAFPVKKADLFLGNAGTAFRPLTAVLALSGGHYRLSGVARMHERPIGDLVDALRQTRRGHRLPRRRRAIRRWRSVPPRIGARRPVSVRGDVSSQFLTALLMALPLTGAERRSRGRGRARFPSPTSRSR